jgi:hypothetical protein
MRALVFASLALVALSSSACDSRDPAPTPNDVAPAWRASRVVVALVVDQLALWHVEERFPHLPETGGFKRLRRESAFAELRYGHLQTSTAIGHSTLFTGAPPHLTRVVANEVLDGDGSDRAIVKDDATRLVGGDGSSCTRAAWSRWARPTRSPRTLDTRTPKRSSRPLPGAPSSSRRRSRVDCP